MSEHHATHEGTCYCGAVSVSVQGPPVASGYCHCESCRKWHAAPINAWGIWLSDNVKISGTDVMISTKDDGSQRVACSSCGGGIANKKPKINMVVVYPMVLTGSDFKFEPTFHIFYDERVMDIADGLPKFVDLPGQFGGTDESQVEPAGTRWRG